jgi:hypothetical protein
MLLVVGCTGGKRDRLPEPPTTVPITTAPPPSDLSGVNLPEIPGRSTTTSVAVLGGDATLTGLVTGPEGPVPGATVRLERLVGSDIGRLDVQTFADGTFRAPMPPSAPTTVAGAPPPPPTPPPAPGGIKGGRYRIRAWRTPDLALTAPQIIFLGGNENRTLSLGISRYSGTRVTSSMAPDPPVVDEDTSLALLVTTRSVDAEGVVRSIGVPSVSLRLDVTRGWQVVRDASSTDGSGRASFLLRCQAPGNHPMRVLVGGIDSFDVPVRECVEAPPPTTSPPVSDPTGSSTSSPTSSTVPAATSTSQG